MMAEHGDLCEGSEASYCTNGGTCYKIPAMSTLTCICRENYRGSRCEELQLFSSSQNSENAGVVAAVVTVSILILVVLSVSIYLTCKMWTQKKEAKKQHSNRQYWQVKPRV